MPAADDIANAPGDQFGPWLSDRQQSVKEALRLGRRATGIWTLIRLAAFLVAAAAWYPLREHLGMAAGAMAGAVGLFVASIIRQKRAAGRQELLRLELLAIEEAMQRLGGKVVNVRSPARPHDSPIAIAPDAGGPTWALTAQERDDLDLYARPVGLFGLLNRTSSALGAQRLRDFLENPCLSVEAIMARQGAVRYLAEHHEERTRLLAAMAALRGLDDEMIAFEGALAADAPPLPPALSVVARIWSTLSFLGMASVLVGTVASAWALPLPVVWLPLVNLGFLAGAWLRIRRSLARWQAAAEFAREYLSIARAAAAELPDKTQLGDLRATLSGLAAPAVLPAGLRWLNWSASGGLIQIILNIFFLYDLHMLEGIRRHWSPRREQLRLGLAAVAQLDSLLSLACFAAEQPTRSWPVPAAGTSLHIEDGLHPLIDPAHAVANTLQLDGRRNLWLITGSNMSGKSTFLRMAGVNVLLAQAGTVATARAMRWSPVRLMSDLRIRDDLGKAESYFLAEVRQLRRMILPPAGDAPLLGLVDEPFRGTNHEEQHAATLAILEHLASSPGLFLIATHDRTLTRLLAAPSADNYHFQEEVAGRQLVFDYRLRPGPAETRNALLVLEREGYPPGLLARSHECFGSIKTPTQT